jgi:hypothetical protein
MVNGKDREGNERETERLRPLTLQEDNYRIEVRGLAE